MSVPPEPDPASGDTYDLVRKARHQLEAGDLIGARLTFEAAVHHGHVSAYVDLADIEARLGQRDLAEGHLQRLNAYATERRDSLLHLELSGAYQLLLGSAGLREQKELALHHLLAAANLGHASAQATLAHWYHHGLNGVVQDNALFEHWAKRAVDAGDPLAVCEYADHLIASKQQVPRALEAAVRELAPHLREAKRLLKRLPANAASQESPPK